jgi:hypothetical protein
MMEQSCITADEWRLGKDLPWKAMLETEDKNIRTNAARKRELSAIDEDILLVASILENWITVLRRNAINLI